MKPIVYALLIGIDSYQPPVPSLSGCVADIEAMETFLAERIVSFAGAGKKEHRSSAV